MGRRFYVKWAGAPYLLLESVAAALGFASRFGSVVRSAANVSSRSAGSCANVVTEYLVLSSSLTAAGSHSSRFACA